MQFQYLYCENSFEMAGYTWFLAASHNGLYQLASTSEKAKLVVRFPGEELTKHHLYIASVIYQSKVIFVPWNAKEIAIYNISDHTLKKMPLPRTYNGDFKFYSAVSYGNYAFFLGARYPAIIRMNLSTEEIHEITDWKEWLGEKNSEYLYLSDGLVRGKYAYCTYAYEDAVLKIDLDTGISQNIFLKSGVRGFCALSDDGENIWLSPTFGNNLMKWNPDSGIVSKISVPNVSADMFWPFYAPLIDGDNIYVIPAEARNAFVIDRNTNMIKKETCFTEILKKELDGEEFVGYITHNPHMVGKQKIAYIHGKDFGWYVYDFATKVDTCVYYETDQKDRSCLIALAMKQMFEKGEMVAECEGASLDVFISCVIDEMENIEDRD